MQYNEPIYNPIYPTENQVLGIPQVGSNIRNDPLSYQNLVRMEHNFLQIPNEPSMQYSQESLRDQMERDRLLQHQTPSPYWQTRSTTYPLQNAAYLYQQPTLSQAPSVLWRLDDQNRYVV
jgi:hypothetical protein